MSLNKHLLALLLFALPHQIPAVDIHKIQLPNMGDSSETLISPIQDKALGEAFFRSLQAQIKINRDPEIQQYIDSIGQQLVSNSDSPTRAFHFFIVLDKQINAFAGPGGYIGINSGLLLLTEAESELASVMAHEVAHITQRHLYRAFEAASRLSIPSAAATIAALLLSTQSPALGQAALMAIQAGSIQFQIDFTRDNEKEADRIGMQTLADANYNPRSMPTFFERLQQSSRYYGQNIPEFLRTHPVSVSRISDTRGRANQYPYQQYPDSEAYLLTQAKLRVLTSTDKQTVFNYFNSRTHQGTIHQRAIARYGMGLVLINISKYAEAETIFQQLSQQYPEQPRYAYALAKTALANQHYKKAQHLLEQGLNSFPSNYALKFEYIATLLTLNQATKAKTILKSLPHRIKQRPLYFELLAQSYAQLDKPAESHRYLAEYYYVKGNTKYAILHIKLAKQAKDINFYLQALLNNRLDFFIYEEKARQSNQ